MGLYLVLVGAGEQVMRGVIAQWCHWGWSWKSSGKPTSVSPHTWNPQRSPAMEHAKPHPQFSDMYSEVIVSSSAGENHFLQWSNAYFKIVLSNFLLRLKLKSASGARCAWRDVDPPSFLLVCMNIFHDTTVRRMINKTWWRFCHYMRDRIVFGVCR